MRYPNMRDLYALKGPQEQVVMRVDWVSDAVRWRQIALSNRLWVRAADQVFEQLTAPEHLFQAMEISGLLRKERTLDIASVTVIG